MANGYGHGGEPTTGSGEEAEQEQTQNRLDRISSDLGDQNGGDSGSSDPSPDDGGSRDPRDSGRTQEEMQDRLDRVSDDLDNGSGSGGGGGQGSSPSGGQQRPGDQQQSGRQDSGSGAYTSPQGTYPQGSASGSTPREQTPAGISEQRARAIRQEVAARDEAVSRYDVDLERRNGQIDASVREGAQRRVAEQRYAQRTPYEEWEVRASDSQVGPTRAAEERVLRERVAEDQGVAPEEVVVDRSMVGESGTSPAGRGRPGEIGPRARVESSTEPEAAEADAVGEQDGEDGVISRFRSTVMDAEVGEVTDPQSPIRSRTGRAAEQWRQNAIETAGETAFSFVAPELGGGVAAADYSSTGRDVAPTAASRAADAVPERYQFAVSGLQGGFEVTNAPALADTAVAGAQATKYVGEPVVGGDAGETADRVGDVGVAGLAVSRAAGEGARANPSEFGGSLATGLVVGGGAGGAARAGASTARAGIRAARRSPDTADATAAARQAQRSDVSPDRPDPWSDIDPGSSLRRLWEDEGGTAQIPRGRRRQQRQRDTDLDPDQPSVTRGDREVLEGSPRDQIQGDIAGRQLEARRQVEADALEPQAMARDPAAMRDPVAEGRILREQAERSEVRVSDTALSGSEAVGQPLVARDSLSTAGVAALREQAQEATVTADEEWEASMLASFTAGVNEGVGTAALEDTTVDVAQEQRARSDTAVAPREDSEQRAVETPTPTPPTTPETPTTPPETPPGPPVTTPPRVPNDPPSTPPRVPTPDWDNDPDPVAPESPESTEPWSLEPTAADRDLEPGWTAETITAAGTLGLESRTSPSQSALESADAPAGELPTTQLLNEDEDVEAVRDLFDPQGSGGEMGDFDLLGFGEDGDSDGGGWF